MKRKLKRALICLLTVLKLVIGTATSASAAIGFQGIYGLSNGNVQFVIKKVTQKETKVKYTFQNTKTKKYASKTTNYTVLNYALGKNMWYKTVVAGYNAKGTKVSSRTLYICNVPTVKLDPYGSSRMQVTWPAAYGSSGYKLYMSSDGGKTFRCVKTTTGRSYITPTLTKYKNYYFYVRAYKNVGSSRFYSAIPKYSYRGYLYNRYY